MDFIFPIFAFFSLLNGSGNEALDFVDSAAYWKVAGIEQSADALIPIVSDVKKPVLEEAEIAGLIKNLSSPDFAERARATAALVEAGAVVRPALAEAKKSTSDVDAKRTIDGILSKVGRDSEDRSRHQLMAIRTLGELGAKQAIPHLEKLKDSPKPFVSEYALRALAMIKGEKYFAKKVELPGVQADLALTFPEVAGIVHAKFASGSGGTEKINRSIGLMAAIDVGPDEMEEAAMEFKEEIAEGVGELIAQIGNFRIDSVTLAFSSDFDFEEGKVGFAGVIRGLIDSENLKALMLRDGVESEVIDGVEWFAVEELLIHLASDRLAVLVFGADRDHFAKQVAARISGKDEAPSSGTAVDLAKELPPNASFLGTIGIDKPDTPLSHLSKISLSCLREGEQWNLRFVVSASPSRKGQRLHGNVWKGIGRLKRMSRVIDGVAKIPEGLEPTVGAIKVEEVAGSLKGEVNLGRDGAAVLSLFLYRYFEFL